MGVEIEINDLTKSFGKQLIWGDVTLTVPAGEICVMLGPSGTGKSVLLKTIIGLLKPDKGEVIIEGVDIASCPEKELYEIRKLFGVLFQDGAMFGSMNLYDNIAFPLREHTKKTESRDPRDRDGEARPHRSARHRGQAARRDLRRYAQARRPRPRPGARPRDRALRRARLRPRPGAHLVPQPADRRPQRADRRDVPDRDPRHQHGPHGAGQHRPALPQAPRHVRSRERCCSPPRSRSCASSSTPRSSGPIGMSEEKDADDLEAEKDMELPPLPPIPMQLDPSNGQPRRSQREPGAWCKENGITPPPGSFEENMSMTTGA